MSWRSCTDDDCEYHEEDKIGARYWPKDPKKHKQSKRGRGKKRTDFGPTLSNERSPTALRDILFLSEYAPPIQMQESIIDTPPKASPVFEPLYSELYLSPGEAERAQSFIGTLHSTLMGDFRPRVLKALELNCYGGSNILKTDEYTRPVRLGVWRIRLGRQSSKNKDKR